MRLGVGIVDEVFPRLSLFSIAAKITLVLLKCQLRENSPHAALRNFLLACVSLPRSCSQVWRLKNGSDVCIMNVSLMDDDDSDSSSEASATIHGRALNFIRFLHK